MAKPKPLPSQQYLQECFEYDPTTGILRWRWRPRHHFNSDRVYILWNGKWAHRSPWKPNSKGYIGVKIDCQRYPAARIIWKLVTGNDPINDVDHRNRIRNDNRWENLREADTFQQSANRGLRCDNALGFKRVTRVTGSPNFQACIHVRGRLIYLGVFPTPEAAHAAYCEAARKYFGEFWTDGSTSDSR